MTQAQNSVSRVLKSLITSDHKISRRKMQKVNRHNKMEFHGSIKFQRKIAARRNTKFHTLEHCVLLMYVLRHEPDLRAGSRVADFIPRRQDKGNPGSGAASGARAKCGHLHICQNISSLRSDWQFGEDSRVPMQILECNHFLE